MKVIYKKSYSGFEEEILDILEECDDEFLPSLSSKRLHFGEHLSRRDLLKIYLKEKVDHEHFLIIEDGKVIAYMNIIPFYIREDWSNKDYLYSVHIDTICVSRNYRGKGLASILYKELENKLNKDRLQNITVTTWSTNKAQQNLLLKLDYDLFDKKLDDRGKGIHTFTFGKKLRRGGK